MINGMSVQKKIAIKKVLVMILVIALIIVPFLGVYAHADKISDLEAKIREIKARSESTKDDIADNKLELKSLNATAKDLKESLNILNADLKAISQSLQEIEGQMSDKNLEIQDLEDELAQAQKIEKDQYEAMKKRIQYMYEEKSYAKFESLLGTSGFGDMLNRSNYFEAVAAYDRQMLVEYQNTVRVIAEAKELLEDEKSELEALKEEAKGQQNRVNDLLERTNISILNYENEILATEKMMLANEEALKAQQEDIATLQTKLAEEKRLSELANASKWRSISQVNYVDGDRKLLANIIYCEAGNQSFEGQLAVGAVIMNRVESEVFPDTIVGVIYQNNQFSPVKSGRLALALANDSATESCYAAADAAMAGQNNVGNCLFFRTPVAGLKGIQIGGHIFY